MDDQTLLYQARHAVYGLLQRLYQDPPDETLLAWLAAERPFQEFPVALDEEATLALQEVDQASQAASAETLRQDFRRLFVGPGPMLAPPWESVYRNEEHRLFDQHTLQVRQTYARHGMEFVRKNETPEDIIAIELEFMKVLTERLLRAVEAGDGRAERILLAEQHRFLKEHLLVWVPRFVALTRKHAETAFYRGLAGVLLGFLQWEEQTLRQLLELLPQDTELSANPAN